MKKKLIIIILILAVVGAALYFFVFSGPKKPEISYYTPGDYFVTNIKDSTRLVKVTIVLGLESTDPTGTEEYLTKVNHVIRDIVVFTLRDKTEEELRSDAIRDTLTVELVKNINEGLGVDYIKTIYFNDFVIQ